MLNMNPLTIVYQISYKWYRVPSERISLWERPQKSTYLEFFKCHKCASKSNYYIWFQYAMCYATTYYRTESSSAVCLVRRILYRRYKYHRMPSCLLVLLLHLRFETSRFYIILCLQFVKAASFVIWKPTSTVRYAMFSSTKRNLCKTYDPM